MRQGAAAVVLLSLLFAFQVSQSPHIRNVQYLYNGVRGETASLPLLLKVSGTGMLSVWFNLDLTESQGTVFTLKIDDCARKLWINGRKVTRPPCNNNKPVDRDLKPYLIAGSNSVRVLIQDVKKSEIGLDLSLSTHAPVIRWPGIAAMIVILLYAVSLFHATLGRKNPLLTALFAGGGLLRLLYVTVTPYNVRAYDVSGHIDYIRYLASHHWFPPVQAGWEFHQPPLYYALMSPLLAIPKELGISFTAGLSWLQCASFFLSIATLFIAYWTGTLLFRRKGDRLSLTLFCLFIATFPALILFASRINNDVLYQLSAFLFLALLLRWWNVGTTRAALLTTLAIALGFLTKASAFLFLPAFWLSIVLRPQTPLHSKLRWILLSGIGVALIAGWFIAIRYQEHDYVRLFSFGGGMNRKLTLTTSWKTFLAFNPLTVILQPFASTWSDASGRQFFWVFFFKTSLFGEFSYLPVLRPFGSLLAALALGLLPILATGIVRAVRSRDSARTPLLLTLVLVLAAAITYRILHPQSPNQDFRFSVLLVPLGAYFIARALRTPRRLLRALMAAWLILFMSASTLFFLMLFAFS